MLDSDRNDGPVSATEIEAAFGPGSPIFSRTMDRFSLIFSLAGHVPQVAARMREWKRRQERFDGQPPADDLLFFHQTYLALLSRLVARRFVAPRQTIAGGEELHEIINCDYFSRRGIGNFGEGDFFSWLALEPRWELRLEDLVLETVHGLVEALFPYDFSQAAPGIMDGLYRQTVPESRMVPCWLAEYVIEEELGLADEPGRSLLDPACGTGAFLSAAIMTLSRTTAERVGDPLDLLFEIPQRIKGMDRDPLAVTLARLNYLLALGILVQGEHPPFLLPVYLADAAQIPESEPPGLDDGAVLLSTPVGEFPLPSPMVNNPWMLDWILGRLTNYMDGAELRLHVQSEDEAVQEVINAYYNYLTAQKPRTPVPEALTPLQADILLETARRLVKLHIWGEGTLWLHLVQNMAIPAAFSRRGFDLLAGSGSSEHLEASSALYLNTEGRAAMITTTGESEASTIARRLVNLDDVLPDAALLVTGPVQRAKLESTSGPVADNLSWAKAKSRIRVVEDATLT